VPFPRSQEQSKPVARKHFLDRKWGAENIKYKYRFATYSGAGTFFEQRGGGGRK